MFLSPTASPASSFRSRTKAARRTCIVRQDNTPYLLSLDAVVDCIDLPAHSPAGTYLDLPEEPLPLISLGEPCIPGPAGKTVVVVVCGQQKAGLVVDRFLGEHPPAQIEPLCRLCRRDRGIAGYAILSTGEVAPVLDIPELVHQAATRSLPLAPSRYAA